MSGGGTRGIWVLVSLSLAVDSTCVWFGEDSSVYLRYLYFIICLLHISKKVF